MHQHIVAHSSEIGRQFTKLDLSPFLGRSTTTDLFQVAGNIWESRAALSTCVKRSLTKSLAQIALSNSEGMPSIPGLLFVGDLDRQRRRSSESIGPIMTRLQQGLGKHPLEQTTITCA